MNRQSQRGIALVITLVMLSVVTFMAVVFLALSRRERVSVKVSEDQATAKLMAESALARAQAQAVATIRAYNNPLAYDLFVSTNYINGQGFKPGVVNPTNVSYTYASGAPLNRADQLQNVANLQIDPRPPVYLPVKGATTNDFRFYLDFNRNGYFEPNGLRTELDRFGSPVKQISAGGTKTVLSPLVGDPEWIGVLEHPDFPHSETNRFVGRYAFIVLPAGKTLDLNYIHNQANTTVDPMNTLSASAYARNQGVGSWELNLAGFFRGLNTNIWGNASYQGYDPLVGKPGTGKAFDEAFGVLSYRYNGSRANLLTMAKNFSGPAASGFDRDRVDSYSDGPFTRYRGPGTSSDFDNDISTVRRWSGSDNYFVFNDVQEILSAKTIPGYNLIKTDLDRAGTNSQSTYDRYTFYRYLASMGVDSPPTIGNLVHLNYTNAPGKIGTNLVPWTRNESFVGTTKTNDFFLYAADAMLRKSVTLTKFTVTNNFFTTFQWTNFMIENDPYTQVRSNINITNIQIYHVPPRTNLAGTSNEYTAPVHRFLQVAANIYDNMTNRGTSYPYLPSVYRPIYRGTATNVTIAGWVQEKGSAFLTNSLWREAATLIDDQGTPNGRLWTNVMVYGQPLVIGAKKGYPNFNEFSVETFAQVTRKLELSRPATNAAVNTTNQMYLLGISNVFGIEAWNSYIKTFPRALRIHAQIDVGMALSNGIAPAVATRVFPLTQSKTLSLITNLTLNANSWEPSVDRLNPLLTPIITNGFRIPLFTNQVFLPDMVFLNNSPWFQTGTLTGFSKTTRVPDWHLYLTNRVIYWAVDTLSGAIVDFVNLDKLSVQTDISDALGLKRSESSVLTSTADLPQGESAFWNFELTNGISKGALAQIATSIDTTNQGTFWRSYSAQIGDKPGSVGTFRDFLGLANTVKLTAVESNQVKNALVHQAPFSPVRKLRRRNIWQPNDPLVHYMEADLRDPSVLSDFVKPNDNAVLKNQSLRHLSTRYFPWGVPPGKEATAQSTPGYFDPLFRDVGVVNSDSWEFPISTVTSNFFVFPSLGALGAVHRGTPWQTIFLKSDYSSVYGVNNSRSKDVWTTRWANHSANYPSHDWNLVGLFTAAINENAARGLMSVNQTNAAAWNALLAGVQVITNTLSAAAELGRNSPTYADLIISPSSPQMSNIVSTVVGAKNSFPGGTFPNLGSVLSASGLSFGSPYVNLKVGLNDQTLEAIPRQILGLMRVDEPRFVIYAYGQSLKPAERSLTTQVNFYNLCTNYQVSGEFISKTVLRIEPTPGGLSQPIRTIVESYNILPPAE